MPEIDFNPRRQTPNPVTRAAYRKQVRWQVYLPLILILLAFALIILAFYLSSTGAASEWADLIVVLLSIPLILLGLVLLGVTIALTIVLTRAIREIPFYTVGFQQSVAVISIRTKRYMNKAANPMIRMQSSLAGWQRGWQVLKSIFKPVRGNDDRNSNEVSEQR